MKPQYSQYSTTIGPSRIICFLHEERKIICSFPKDFQILSSLFFEKQDSFFLLSSVCAPFFIIKAHFFFSAFWNEIKLWVFITVVKQDW